MASITIAATPAQNRQGAWLPEGEIGVLTCILAIPLIWAALVGAMLCSCDTVFQILLAAAAVVGLGADGARLVWLRRQAGR